MISFSTEFECETFSQYAEITQYVNNREGKNFFNKWFFSLKFRLWFTMHYSAFQNFFYVRSSDKMVRSVQV